MACDMYRGRGIYSPVRSHRRVLYLAYAACDIYKAQEFFTVAHPCRHMYFVLYSLCGAHGISDEGCILIFFRLTANLRQSAFCDKISFCHKCNATVGSSAYRSGGFIYLLLYEGGIYQCLSHDDLCIYRFTLIHPYEAVRFFFLFRKISAACHRAAPSWSGACPGESYRLIILATEINCRFENFRRGICSSRKFLPSAVINGN